MAWRFALFREWHGKKRQGIARNGGSWMSISRLVNTFPPQAQKYQPPTSNLPSIGRDQHFKFWMLIVYRGSEYISKCRMTQFSKMFTTACFAFASNLHSSADTCSESQKHFLVSCAGVRQHCNLSNHTGLLNWQLYRRMLSI